MNRQVSDTFREEGLEILGEFEEALLELEERPTDGEGIDRVFRALHTLKGSGSMAGFEAVASFAHELETIFEMVRCGKIGVDRTLINITLASRDQFREMIDSASENAGDAQAVRQIIASLRKLAPAEGAAGKKGGLGKAASPAGEMETYRLRFRPDPGLFRRGINPLSLLHELGRMGECRSIAQSENVPSLENLDPEQCFLYWDIILTTDQGMDAIRDVFIFVEDAVEIRIELIDSDTLAEAEVEYKKLGEILVERGDLSIDDLQQVISERRRLGETLVASGLVSGTQIDSALLEQEQVRQARRRRQLIETASGIRVRSEKLDALVDLVGELVTVQARLSQHTASHNNAGLQLISEEVERLTWSLRDQVLGIRMLPIGTTFSRFRRLVRDLAEELGKNIELITEGAETELDKTVIEHLGDPLVHLIRNGIDHGLEMPQVRQAAGKGKKGRIWLSAAQAGANVLIEVRDDGRGLDRAAIRQRGIAQGLIGAEAEIGDRDLLNLIFLPGFSTASSVTSVSGRGVGMDVVKRAVEALRGSIEVQSRPGEGTTFQVLLPLTLAIIDGLLVRSATSFYILPLSAVEECVQLRRQEVTGNDRRLVRVRDEIVPYIRLREVFALPGEAPPIEQVAIVNADGQRFGLAVDAVIGGHQTVIKNLGRVFRDVAGLSGATLLGDGTVALILDLQAIIRRQEIFEKKAI
ncbi:MAG: chemotaxis protein CheA [Desulfuromonadales bacterium]